MTDDRIKALLPSLQATAAGVSTSLSALVLAASSYDDRSAT